MTIDAAAYARDLFWLVPELWLTLVGFVLLIASPLVKDPAGRRRMAWGSVIGQAVALLLMFYLYAGLPGVFGPASPGAPGAVYELQFGAGRPLLLVDGFAIVLKAVVLISGILATMMGIRLLETDRIGRGEFHAVLVFAVVGAMFLISSTDFISLFVGLETMSLSVYLLVGWARDSRKSNEAALKYFLLGALASGLLLYGISLAYGATGTTNLFGLSVVLAAGPTPAGGWLITLAILFLVVGCGFKMAAVPFHVWTPDAYEGAPTLVTSFMATAVKTAAFAMALRVFLIGFDAPAQAAEWTWLFGILSAASMTAGNVIAVLQDNVKRMLAYSSIAHVGYALMGLVAAGAALAGWIPEPYRTQAIELGQFSVVIYMVAYAFTAAGAFAVVVMLRREGIPGDRIDDFSGMARRAPGTAAMMLIFLLSLAGIPATAGFIGKWWLFASILQGGGYRWLAVLAALNTAISLYYYLRVAVRMYMQIPAEELPYAVTPALTAAIFLAAVGTLAIGLWPEPVLRLVAGTAQLLP